ncbi:26S proteasome regulatory subunit T3 [Nematocida parisii]|uniref:26S proteasome regulatory subunit 6B homolog n=1 Tax=Nematocida parisii (strain ERTm3) TaxID=935791 RepID=I3EFX0_NEMP3|nr:26s proteasome regulatory subunit 6 [Nematocida parisii ERTm1]EIJ88117.1 26s proteasome regulatory subunit 6 [Nematocida parisii ERTm3]KAI5130779.1 26S proteasome regulatory subunit T3 [Nematocida parisii]KAI5166582.1 26S proteasome regulatory subunit T3 [Nematocida sp. AWRm79]KAI5183605.1 26S proteasome regulatory subunit T3 [Nematocida sp. AWRm78]OAG32894.1 26S proteasome regulatory subunit T3 [Nematocida sp. ERTm5]|eukprot:XP_013059217.1 26s proteasome regulatory subunit 6 [Nematocida parisii ERTm1]
MQTKVASEEGMPKVASEDGMLEHKICLEMERELELVNLKEQYILEEIKSLKKELIKSQQAIERVKSVPLIMGHFLEAIDSDTAIIGSTAGSNSIVKVLSTVNKELLKPNTSVALHRHSSALVDVLPPEADNIFSVLGEEGRPNVKYSDIGGLDSQKQEIREAIELPLTDLALYQQIGIEPPRGVLLYGPPGTGKTMLVKAVAHHTKATFIRVNGSEFVQKYLGEGPRMVRDIFRLAIEKAPSIIFIDEVDSIATTRFDSATSADREVQRVLIELLNQMDGFDQTTNVKVIMATNRADTIDPALLRPGRLDRKIEFPVPDRRQKRMIFTTITNKMSLSSEVNLEGLVVRSDKLSAAEINSICQEAGMLAVRNGRYMVIQSDFEAAYARIVEKKNSEHGFYY